MAALGPAAGSGLLVSDAAAQVSARREDDDGPPPLVLVASNRSSPVLLAHGSHRSHSSHRSHYSSRGGSWGGGYSSGSRSYSGSRAYSVPDPAPEPPPPPPKPGRVTVIAYPGGRIYLDGKAVGRDATGTLILKPGAYTIRVENRFMGDHSQTIEITDGQTGTINIDW